MFEDGQLIEKYSDHPENDYAIDLDRFNTLHVGTSEENGSTIVEIDEENVLTSDYGLNMIVYDKILGKVVDIRSYQDEVLIGY